MQYYVRTYVRSLDVSRSAFLPRFFVGSPESTFTFRIQEEREIRGFEVQATFSVLCPDGKFDCEKGSVWKIKYPDKKNRVEL